MYSYPESSPSTHTNVRLLYVPLATATSHLHEPGPHRVTPSTCSNNPVYDLRFHYAKLPPLRTLKVLESCSWLNTARPHPLPNPPPTPSHPSHPSYPALTSVPLPSLPSPSSLLPTPPLPSPFPYSPLSLPRFPTWNQTLLKHESCERKPREPNRGRTIASKRQDKRHAR